MKILHVIRDLSRSTGGSVNALVGLANGLMGLSGNNRFRRLVCFGVQFWL